MRQSLVAELTTPKVTLVDDAVVLYHVDVELPPLLITKRVINYLSYKLFFSGVEFNKNYLNSLKTELQKARKILNKIQHKTTSSIYC